MKLKCLLVNSQIRPTTAESVWICVDQPLSADHSMQPCCICVIDFNSQTSIDGHSKVHCGMNSLQPRALDFVSCV